jgi:hypothetical protein
MRAVLFGFLLLLCASDLPLQSQEQQTKTPGHYLFAWTGDFAYKGNDFLAVIDADPAFRTESVVASSGTHLNMQLSSNGERSSWAHCLLLPVWLDSLP